MANSFIAIKINAGDGLLIHGRTPRARSLTVDLKMGCTPPVLINVCPCCYKHTSHLNVFYQFFFSVFILFRNFISC